MAANYAHLREHLTPVLKLGHDRQQVLAARLKASTGFINVGRVVDAGLTPDGNCFVIRRAVGVPVDVGEAINAGFISGGSVEIKPGMNDPADPARVLRGPILTAVALLGEEPPALKDKRLTRPVAVFPDGRPVPAATRAGPWLEMMADVSRTFSEAADPDAKTLCFSDYTPEAPEKPAVTLPELVAAFQALPPDQQAAFQAQCGASAAPAGPGKMADGGPNAATTPPAASGAAAPTQTPAVAAPPGGNMADQPAGGAPGAPAGAPAYFTAFADEMKKCFADLTGRVGAVEAANKQMSDEAAKDQDQLFSERAESIFKEHNGPRKLTPQAWGAKKRLLVDLAKTKEFSAADTREKLFSDFAAEMALLPVSPMIDPSQGNPAPKAGLTDLQRGILNSETMRRHGPPAVRAKLLAPKTA